MDVRYNHEKILIIVALTLCAGILFYNAFFVPQISIPSVIYVDGDGSSQNSSERSSTTDETAETSTEKNNNPDGNAVTSSKVNINTATLEELETLDGIGSAIAKRIIEYRTTVSKFSSIEEIKNVSGIGEKIFEKFKDNICV